MKRLIFGLLFISAIGTTDVNAQVMSTSEKISQVYLDFVPMLSPDQYDWLADCISRVTVMDISLLSGQNISSLDDIPILDKYGASLVRDTDYDESTFNPLKYMFNFTQPFDQYFQIGTTNQIIKIAKQD